MGWREPPTPRGLTRWVSRLTTGVYACGQMSSYRPLGLGDAVSRAGSALGQLGTPADMLTGCAYRLQRPAAAVSPHSCPHHHSLLSPPHGHRHPAAAARAQGRTRLCGGEDLGWVRGMPVGRAFSSLRSREHDSAHLGSQGPRHVELPITLRAPSF